MALAGKLVAFGFLPLIRVEHHFPVEGGSGRYRAFKNRQVGIQESEVNAVLSRLAAHHVGAGWEANRLTSDHRPISISARIDLPDDD
jgi:hypothetical protein